MSVNRFWHQRQIQPKRKFRWIATLGDGNTLYNYQVRSITKPEWTTTVKEHDVLGHRFKFPGNVTWNDVDVVITDLAGDINDLSAGNAALFLQDAIYSAGYQYPTSIGDASLGITKARATTALGGMEITQLDAEGRALEVYTFHNPFINKVTFGDSFDYGSDEFVETTLSISYDWAKITSATEAGVDTDISINAVDRLRRMGLSGESMEPRTRPSQGGNGQGGTY